MHISICETCPLGQSGFAHILQSALASLPFPSSVTLTECMSGCARESTLAFRSSGKVAYLFGDLTAQDLPNLLTFAALYHASSDGRFDDARPLGALRSKALTRIPG